MQPQPPYQPPHQPQYRPPNAPPTGTNQLALVSVISGAIGYMGVPIVASIIAIVCGHMARAEIRKTGQDGDGLAILGLVLGYSHIVLACLGVALVIAIYGGIAAFFVAHGVSR